MGDDEHPAEAALWLGESWARGFGSPSPIPNFVEGGSIPDGPGRLRSTLYLGADAVLTHAAGARLWLSYGSYEIDSSGPDRYDRRLHGWIAELVLEGRLVTPELRAFYLAPAATAWQLRPRRGPFSTSGLPTSATTRLEAYWPWSAGASQRPR
jgi:hypothetical protein